VAFYGEKRRFLGSRERISLLRDVNQQDSTGRRKILTVIDSGAGVLDHFDKAKRLHRAGRLKEALTGYRIAARSAPADGRVLLHLATLLRKMGEIDDALAQYLSLLKLEPDNAPVHNAVGQIFAERAEWEPAFLHLSHSVVIAQSNADYKNDLANVLKKLGRIDEAEFMFRKLVDADTKNAHTHYNLAMLLVDRKDYRNAADLLANALKNDPGSVKARLELAMCHEKTGRFAEAIEQYLAVLDQSPRNLRAISNLLSLRAYRPSADLVERAIAIVDHDKLEPDIAARTHQSIGKYYDAAGRYREALARFILCNSLQKRSVAMPFATRVDTIVNRYDGARFRRRSTGGSTHPRLVFIVGMPRSGTTLVEQIFSGHSSVFGAGELPHIPNLVSIIERSGSIDDDTVWERAAQEYRQAIAALAPPGATHITDKLPINFLHLGGVVKMFPDAAIVHCRRDHRDVAISCFIEMFASNELDLSSLDGIADAIIGKERLMAHWRSVLPVAILDVDYSALIDDFDVTCRQMLGHVGLEWQASCQNYHELDRAVDTPSRWQVRQPIYSTSRGRWRNYEDMIGPLLSRLRAAALI